MYYEKLVMVFSVVVALFMFSMVLVSADSMNPIPAKGISVRTVPIEVYRNSRRVNYRVHTDWYFAYSYSVGASHGVGISRTIRVYLRVVSYTLEYDIYNSTGKFLRHEKKQFNNHVESQHR